MVGPPGTDAVVSEHARQIGSNGSPIQKDESPSPFTRRAVAIGSGLNETDEFQRRIDTLASVANVSVCQNQLKSSNSTGESHMGANHAGERKRKKLKNTKKILNTQIKKAKAKAS